MASKDSKPTGLKLPSKIGRTSGIAKPSKTSSVSSSRAHSPEGGKQSDDFIIGDRVYVGGTKPGVIAYLGVTKFATGDWAGVILDELEGKNDGSVQGVRYFQCEPKRGVFAKPSKLTSYKVNSVGIAPPKGAPSIQSTPKTSKVESRRESIAPPPNKSSLPKKNGSISASNTSLSSAAMATVGAKHIKVGERVVVNGTKVGTLRFLGTTDFAAGEWAGVELVDAIGKNDGSVGGKRYFECKPLYGLFAPVHKVTRESVAQAMSPTISGRATPSLMQQKPSHRLCSTPAMGSSLNSRSKDMSGSQDSLSSIGSAISTASRSRVRLGVTSLRGPNSSSTQAAANRVAQARQAYKSVSTTSTNTTAALQKALKEKEEHIEQLIRERELERTEVFKTSIQKEELEEELNKTKVEFENVALDADFRVNELELKVENLQEEKKELELSLAEQKTQYERKLEDLQFQMEEEAISRSDQSDASNLTEELDKLKARMKTENEAKKSLIDQVSKLQRDLDVNINELTSAQSQAADLRSQISTMESALTVAESKLISQEKGNEDFVSKTAELEALLVEKDSLIKAIEENSSQLKSQINELESETNSNKAAIKGLESELNESKLEGTKANEYRAKLESEMEVLLQEKASLNSLLADTKLQVSDLQRSLETSEAAKMNISGEKAKLQEHIDDLMRNSGDRSQQLTMLNDELRERDRLSSNKMYYCCLRAAMLIHLSLLTCSIAVWIIDYKSSN
ncbi:CLIP2 [Bugula neritina]|uniref:CLIP2 n=1 Tax=Bugula neritina TaxID=10212 RepID=A0A7J7JED9_BUGNE|nr:CLIP2 [Bugula neritina]